MREAVALADARDAQAIWAAALVFLERAVAIEVKRAFAERTATRAGVQVDATAQRVPDVATVAAVRGAH